MKNECKRSPTKIRPRETMGDVWGGGGGLKRSGVDPPLCLPSCGRHCLLSSIRVRLAIECPMGPSRCSSHPGAWGYSCGLVGSGLYRQVRLHCGLSSGQPRPTLGHTALGASLLLLATHPTVRPREGGGEAGVPRRVAPHHRVRAPLAQIPRAGSPGREKEGQGPLPPVAPSPALLSVTQQGLCLGRRLGLGPGVHPFEQSANVLWHVYRCEVR